MVESEWLSIVCSKMFRRMLQGDYEWPLDGEEIMLDDTHCFDCCCLLEECTCDDELEEPVERGIAWG